MQATLRIRQARPRGSARATLLRSIRLVGAFAGELLALASLTAALAAGIVTLTGILP